MIKGVLIFLVAILTAGQVAAQYVYRWVDENGETHYGHAVPTEHKDRGYERLGPDGQVLHRVGPALTAEERAERDRQRAIEAERQAEREAQNTRDQRLLAAYRSEQDLISARDVQLRSVDNQRVTIRTSMERSSRRFETLVARAAQLTRDGESVPEQLNANINQTREELRELRQGLADLDQREAEVRERFEQELARFRALTSSDSG